MFHIFSVEEHLKLYLQAGGDGAVQGNNPHNNVHALVT